MTLRQPWRRGVFPSRPHLHEWPQNAERKTRVLKRKITFSKRSFKTQPDYESDVKMCFGMQLERNFRTQGERTSNMDVQNVGTTQLAGEARNAVC